MIVIPRAFTAKVLAKTPSMMVKLAFGTKSKVSKDTALGLKEPRSLKC
jgi:hypothetical protein